MADEWLWAFGDGMTSTLASPVYTYTQGGVYTVTQWVTDTATGEADVLTRTDFITVAEGTGDLVTTTIAYDYDPLYRLITATYSSGEVYTYTYDQLGNRLAMGADGELITYTYDAGDSWSPAKLLTWVDDVEYTWDDGDQRSHGNLLDNGVFSYTYNRGDHRSPANRLVSVEDMTTTVVYTYNGDGHRMAKAVDGVTTTYVVAVLGLSQVLVETTGGESVVYLYGHDLLAEEGGSGWAWHLDDGLGSVRQLADADGKVTLAQGYTPFGVPLWDAGSGTTGYGFTGERWEAYSQLLFLRARYYQPGAGRFISKDLWGGSKMRPATLNGFIYVSNNPVRFTDLLGLCGTDPYDPYYDYECWILAQRVAELTGEPLETVGKSSYYWLLRAYEELKNEPATDDPLTSKQRMFTYRYARLFEIPFKLVAGTIATEIVDDTQWHDPILDAFLKYALAGYAEEEGADPSWSYSELDEPWMLWTEFLGGYEHYFGLLEGRGPGPGVANVHVGTAKAAEDYFSAYYPELRVVHSGQVTLMPHPDVYQRLEWLLEDESNIRYTAAILKQLADLRKGSCGEPKLGPHLHDLTLVDMQIIYGAFRAGWDSYDGTIEGYQQWEVPGTYGKQIYRWLIFYD